MSHSHGMLTELIVVSVAVMLAEVPRFDSPVRPLLYSKISHTRETPIRGDTCIAASKTAKDHAYPHTRQGEVSEYVMTVHIA